MCVTIPESAVAQAVNLLLAPLAITERARSSHCLLEAPDSKVCVCVERGSYKGDHF